MHKSILFALLCATAVFAVACGSGNNSNKPANGSNAAKTDGGDPKTDTADAFALYKKQGRTWMHKSVSKTGDTENVSFMKYEVTKLADDHAMVTMTMLDKDKKPSEYMKPTETKYDFKPAEAPKGDAPKVAAPKEEKMSAAGADWDCYVTEMDNAGMKTKSWSSKKYPGLLIKSETTGETAGMKMNSTMELIEWKE